MALKSQSRSSGRPAFLRLAYSAPVRRESTAEEVCRFLLPATKALPFVKLRANDQPLWRPESFWHVTPTGRRDADIRLGRRYAREAIAAMRADRNSDLIAHVIQDVIADEQRRKKRRGGLSPIVRGFLIEISEAIATAR